MGETHGQGSEEDPGLGCATLAKCLHLPKCPFPNLSDNFMERMKRLYTSSVEIGTICMVSGEMGQHGGERSQNPTSRTIKGADFSGTCSHPTVSCPCLTLYPHGTATGKPLPAGLRVRSLTPDVFKMQFKKVALVTEVTVCKGSPRRARK